MHAIFKRYSQKNWKWTGMAIPFQWEYNTEVLLKGIVSSTDPLLKSCQFKIDFLALRGLWWVVRIVQSGWIGHCHLWSSLSEYSILYIKSAVKPLPEPFMHMLKAMLRTKLTHIVIIIVLGLIVPYDHELRFQTCHLAFQMPSCDTLFFKKNAYSSKDI